MKISKAADIPPLKKRKERKRPGENVRFGFKKASSNYVVLRAVSAGRTHRGRYNADVTASQRSEYFARLAWISMDDPDLQEVQAQANVKAMALLHGRAKLRRCTKCNNPDIVFGLTLAKFGGYYNRAGYICWACRTHRPDSRTYISALRRLWDKYKVSCNQGVIVSHL